MAVNPLIQAQLNAMRGSSNSIPNFNPFGPTTGGGMPPGGGGMEFHPNPDPMPLDPSRLNNSGFSPTYTPNGFSSGPGNMQNGVTNFNNVGFSGDGTIGIGFDYGPGLGGQRTGTGISTSGNNNFTLNGGGPRVTGGGGTTGPLPDLGNGYWASYPDGSTRWVGLSTGLTNRPIDIITPPPIENYGGGNSYNPGGGNSYNPGGGNSYNPGGGNNNGNNNGNNVINTPLPVPPSNSRIYTRVDYLSDKVEENGLVVTRGIWGNNGEGCDLNLVTGSMYNFYTSSAQTTKQKEYWYDVLINPANRNCDVEFSVTYGHYQGSGSYSGGGQLNDSPSRSIYSQMRLITDTINDENKFLDQDNNPINDIYCISISKDRMRDKLDPGNWELNLSELNGGSFANSFYTGSNVQISGSGKVISLIDDSLDTDETISTGGLVQNRYKVYSGSIVNGIHSTGSHYGYMYPNLGLIVLNGSMLNTNLSFNTYSSSNSNGDNAYKLFTSISGSATLTGSRVLQYPFDARNVKVKTTTHYFLRVRSYEYNYSNNPTFRSGSDGDFKHPTFVRDPKTFITAIGMYNDNYDLLAVAKLSKPLIKSFTNEASITVKLEY